MREIDITFNEQELQFILLVLDLTVRTDGLKYAENCLMLAKKINQAAQVETTEDETV